MEGGEKHLHDTLLVRKKGQQKEKQRDGANSESSINPAEEASTQSTISVKMEGYSLKAE